VLPTILWPVVTNRTVTLGITRCNLGKAVVATADLGIGAPRW
jgi:hypothetical protein